MRFRLRLKKKLSSGAGKATGAYKTHKKTLRKMRGPSEKGFHDLRLDGKTIGQALAENKYEEIFDRESLLKSLLKKKDQGTVKKKFKEFSTSKEAENFIKELLKLDANYDNLDVSVANDVNQELIRAYNIFGTVGIIGSVHVDDERVNGDVYASYDDNPPNSLLLRSDRNREDVKAKMEKNPEGYFSTRSWLHPYRH